MMMMIIIIIKIIMIIIIIIIIIMKTFNGHHGATRTLTWIARIHSHTFTSTQLQPRCAKRQLSCYMLWNRNYNLKVPEGGEQTEYPEKTPDSLPANRYHILQDKIQSRGRIHRASQFTGR